MSSAESKLSIASSASVDLPRQLFGYEVLGHLGDGAGSRIYAVSHETTRQVYALKHVVRKDDKSIRFVEQLENEFSVGKLVRHKHLRGVVNLHVNRSMMLRVTEAALVMEMFDGIPLDVRLPKRVSDIVACFALVADAIHAMHDAGFVHCDLKPANVLVAPDGSGIRVIDLGQACRIGTIKQRIQGTPDYIAPEQVKCKPVIPQTDVYNFGASLYWCLTGTKMPTLFTLTKGENSFLVDSQIQTPAQLNPFVPESLSAFVMECVRVNALKRPESMATLKTRLEVLHHAVLKAETARRSSVA
jgi:serine/threonine protein kinase